MSTKLSLNLTYNEAIVVVAALIPSAKMLKDSIAPKEITSSLGEHPRQTLKRVASKLKREIKRIKPEVK